MNKITGLLIIALLLLSLTGGELFAAIRTSSQSGNWTSVATWGGNSAPAGKDTVIINGNFTVTVDTPGATCNSLQLGGITSGSGAGTLSFKSGARVTVGSTFTVGAGDNKGSTTMALGGTLVCPGFILNSLGTWTPGTGTVELTASNTLSGGGITGFYNLTVSGGTTSLGANLAVIGNLVIDPGAELSCGADTLTIGGTWTNNGTFTAGTGTVTFSGIAGQGLSKPGGESFSNLTINKTSGALTLNSPVTVTGTFALTQGTIAIGSNTLTLNSPVTGGGSLTSDVTGTVIYNQASPGQNVLAATYGNLSFSDYPKTLPSTGSIEVAGSFSPGIAAGHTVTGSTFDFNGGAQTVPVFPYNNLTVSGTGIKTGPPALTVNGNHLVKPGVMFIGLSALILNGTVDTVGGTLNASTLNVGSGGTLTNNGIVTAVASLTGTGTIMQGTSGTLYIGGTIDIATFNVSAVGNTVVYSGAGQTIRPALYQNLMLGGSGSPTITGIATINGNFTLSGTVGVAAVTAMTIGGNFTIVHGASFDAGTSPHSVRGNFSNMGSLTPGTSTFTLNGSAPQSIGGSTLYTLVINNAAGVSMSADVTVSNSLQLTAGALSLGPHTLTLNGSLSAGAGSLVGGASSGLVLGGSGDATTLPGITLGKLTLNRPSKTTLAGDVTIDSLLTINAGSLSTGASTVILAPGSFLSESPGHTVIGHVTTTQDITGLTGTVTFGNIGADFVFPGTSYLGLTTIRRTTGIALTGAAHSSIRRYFDITPGLNFYLNVGLVFHFDQSELSGQDPAALELYQFVDSNATWQDQGGIVNTANRTVYVPGVLDFSRFTASDTSNRLGYTGVPSVGMLFPASSDSGGPGFMLTVLGRNYVYGKSTIRFNGSDRPTTYVGMGELHAAIPPTDLFASGNFPVTVFTTGAGGLSNSLNFTVNQGGEVTVGVETAPDGVGVVVPAQTLGVWDVLRVYAVARGAGGRFIRNVGADAWTLEEITGSVVPGDLGHTDNGAAFRGNGLGSAVIKATFHSLIPIPSGTITVQPPASVAEGSVPLTYALMQNFPNPFNPSTEIKFDLPYAGEVSLNVYDVLGQKVASLAAGHYSAGHHSVTWNASGQASGMYFCRLQAGDAATGKDHTFVATRCLLLLR
jgi:hypothetical protein